jgi:hypothetical protein
MKFDFEVFSSIFAVSRFGMGLEWVWIGESLMKAAFLF